MKNIIAGLVCTQDPLECCGSWLEEVRGLLEELEARAVLAPRAIGSWEEAEEAAERFAGEGVELVVLGCLRLAGDGRIVEPFLRRGQTLMVWCLPEPARTGPLPLNSMTCANLYMSSAKGLEGAPPVKWLYGAPGDPLVRRRLGVTLRALRGRRALSGAVVVQVGQIAPGFVNLRYDGEAVRKTLGVEIREYGLETVFSDMEAADPQKTAELARVLPQGAARCEGTEEELVKSARLTLALEALQERTGASALAVSCWPEFQRDLHVSVCLAFARLNEKGLPVSCEGDALGAAAMLAAKAMGAKAPMLMDLVAMDQEADAISFWHCGMGVPCHGDTEGFAVTKYPADPRVLDLPGVGVDVKFAAQPVTVCRLSGKDGGRLFVCEAEIVPGPDRGFDGARGWFSRFSMEGRPMSALEFLDTALTSGTPHHYVIAPGRLEAALREMAVRMGLETVRAMPYTDGLR